MKVFFLLLFMVTALPVFANYSFLLRDKRYPERPFIVNLPVTNANGISTFESYLMKGSVVISENGDPEVGIMNGTLVHVNRSSRHDWDFAFNGNDLEFSDLAMELCDGQFLDIEENPDYWFGTLGRFCPWGTRGLVDEIRKNGKIIYQRH